MREPSEAMRREAARAVGNWDIAHDALVRAMDAALNEDREAS